MKFAIPLAAMMLLAASASAGTAPVSGPAMAAEPPIYMIEVHYLKPGKEKVYENAVVHLVQALRAEHVAMPNWDFSVVSNGGSIYATIDPAKNWASLDILDDDVGKVTRLLGDRMTAFRAEVRSARDHENDFLIEGESSDDDPGALGENGRDFIHVDLYHGKDMHELVAELQSIKVLYRASHVVSSANALDGFPLLKALAVSS
jgi:hypothetical protein